ncbi:MAG: hypothetical protein KC736_02680 [Candidatus Moranbacteria bacterium]|nr:hypothetical protein [Candidatus Moranbacteria bacterium]
MSIDGGSIGIWAARLWKREVACLILPPSWETPWDSTPVIGISQMLGYVFLRPVNSDDVTLGWVVYRPVLSTIKYYRDHKTMIVHVSLLSELRESFSVRS